MAVVLGSVAAVSVWFVARIDSVVGNTIVNTWDCGIETVGVVTDSAFNQ